MRRKLYNFDTISWSQLWKKLSKFVQIFKNNCLKTNKNFKLLIDYLTTQIYLIRSITFKNSHYFNELIDFNDFSSIKILKNFINCKSFIVSWNRKVSKYRTTIINFENRFNFKILQYRTHIIDFVQHIDFNHCVYSVFLI